MEAVRMFGPYVGPASAMVIGTRQAWPGRAPPCCWLRAGRGALPWEIPVDHVHNALDVQPGTVTLCMSTGADWHHVPVAESLWAGATEETRAEIFGIAQRQITHLLVSAAVVRSGGVVERSLPHA